jgi:quercetin dioxygenase-like cupin family protein
MSEQNPIVRKSSHLAQEETRRIGIKERKLLLPEDSPHQNIVLIDADEGAEVELHSIGNSESIIILKGRFEVILPNSIQTLEEGDLCYFHPKSAHGLHCTQGPGQFVAIFAPTKHNMPDDWLKTLYTEAWGQYIHEDKMGITRNTLFLGVQAAFIAILASLVEPMINLDTTIIIFTKEFQVGLALLGGTLTIFTILMFLLAGYWKEVTKTGRTYLNLRWLTIRAIEEHLSLSPINLAGIEHEWRAFSENNPRSEYYPFINSEYESLKELHIPSKGKIGGWLSLTRTISLIRIFWLLLSAIGLLLIAISA